MTEGPGRPRSPLPTSVDSLPDLPPAFDRALEVGLRALRLELTAAARRAIEGHVRLLLAWTPAINLTSLRDPAEIATRHVIDSLTGLRVLREGEAILDLGSGGGFPGLTLAAVRPGMNAVLVESIGKKARFLEAAVAAAGLASRVGVLAERAEALARRDEHRERWPVVTARAVGDLAELVELALPLLRVEGRLIAWKRAPLDSEAAAAGDVLAALGGGSIDVVPAGIPALPGHVLVVVTKRGRTPDGYPRDRGLRKRRPS